MTNTALFYHTDGLAKKATKARVRFQLLTLAIVYLRKSEILNIDRVAADIQRDADAAKTIWMSQPV